MEQEQKKQLSVPNAIILAGIIIAGAVLLTNYSPSISSGNIKVGQEALYDKTGNLNLGSANALPSIEAEKPIEKASPTLAPVSETDHVRYIGTMTREEILKSAKLTIIEYSDLECPFCKKFHPTMQQIIEAYPGQVVWVYRHFPLDSIHSKSRTESNASECAYEQGGDTTFWKYMDKIFEITPANNGLDLTKLSTVASDFGLNMTKFKTCLQNDTYAQKIQSQYESGVKAGVEGTPASFITTKDGRYAQIMGAESFESIKTKIDKLLKN